MGGGRGEGGEGDKVEAREGEGSVRGLKEGGREGGEGEREGRKKF